MSLGLPLAQHAASVVLNLVAAVAAGTVATRLWIARLGSPWSQLQDRRASRTGVAALAVAMVASAWVLWLEAAAMAEVPAMQAGEATWTMLAATHYGAAWQVGIAALVASMLAMVLARPGRHKRSWLRASGAGIAAFLYTRSMVSHASAAGDFTFIMLVDWVHLLLVCLWVGEVVVAGMMVLPSPPGEALANRTDCSRYVESLSMSASVALVGIFATGFINAWYKLGSPRALIGNPYGTALLVKLALVLGAAALGGMNRFFVMPGLIASLRSDGVAPIKVTKQFTMVLRVEALLLLAALVMAVILSSTSPPTAG